MNRVRPLLSPILVGRDDLLELAGRRIAEAASGHGQLLLLAGEAGVGKTRMLSAILRKAAGSGFRVAKGDISPQDSELPLASILDLARTMRRVPAFGPLGDDLLATHRPAGGDQLGARRALVFEIAERILAAGDAPTLLAFEDLQWADELSLEVIAELARLGRERPILLVGAYRLDELPMGSVHREWRARLLGQRLAEEARLTPLSREETALVTTLILGTGLPAPREVADAVYERTDGIPLHIEELLGALGEDARQDGRAIRDAQVPSTIEDAVLARVNRLSAEARAVARAGAVIGRCFSPEVLAGIMDRALPDLDEPLAELVAHTILYTFGAVDAGYFDFRHQLLRDALYGSVPTGDLRRLHARAAEFGAQLDGASEVHASVHFERAGLRPQAYRAALAAAREASAVSSRREAFELYRRAVANVPDGLPSAELAELHEGYCDAAAAVDRVAVIEEAAEAARRHYLAAGMPAKAAEMLLVHAAGARRNIRPITERTALLDLAAAEISTLPTSTERARLEADLSIMRAIADLDALRLDRARAALDSVRRDAAAAGQVELVADVDFLVGTADVVDGRIEAGLAAALRVAREARAAGFESTGVTAYRDVAQLGVRVMDYATAEVGLGEGLRYADEIEQSFCRHVMASTSALVAWAAGRWDEAIAIAAQALVDPGSRRCSLGARDALGFVAFGRGEVEAATAHLEASLADGRESGEPALVLPALWGLAETALVAGEPAVAVGHCQAALELAVASGERALLVPFAVTGVRASLAARRPDAAGPWLRRVGPLLAGWEELARPALDHGEALVRLSAGSTVMARTALEAAIRGWEERGRTWEAACARLDLVACLLRANRPADALALLPEVRALAERLGSAPLLERARELAGLARHRGAEEEPWRPLTAREFEIARLVGDGLTNGAIAQELALSPRTVSSHVEHILAKLGATRRAEIASWVSSIRPATASDAATAASIAATSRPVAAVTVLRR